MARNLIGYFGGGDDCTQYSIKIIANPTSSVFEEIYLSGDSPVVVTYDTSNTPFDPIRASRATITVVADNKLLDVFSSDAHGTQVILTNTSTGKAEWVGYLTPNLLNMPKVRPHQHHVHRPEFEKVQQLVYRDGRPHHKRAEFLLFRHR